MMAPEAVHTALHQTFTAREDELIELHRALVRIPTVNAAPGHPAGEDRLARFATDWLAGQAGICARALEGAPGRANLLAEVGDGPRRMLWMSHADVVPAGDEAAWKYPPFAGELAEGRIWGRGANDCKMLVAAQLFAIAELARLGLPRGGRIVLAVGADEEQGGRLGFGWLAEHHADDLRAELAICEGGGSALGRFGGGPPVIGVAAGEKGKLTVTFRARAAGGHACSPWGRPNPVMILAGLVERIAQWRSPISIEAPIFRHVAAWAGLDEPLGSHNLEDAIGRIGRDWPALARSLRGQSRNSFTPTVFRAGQSSNVIPDEATLVCDVRLLPGQEISQVEGLARELSADLEGVEFTIGSEVTPPSLSEMDEPLLGMFERSAARALGQPVAVVPSWCVGATDARYVRMLGTPVYGFQLIHPDADPAKLGIHCVNESIEARMLLPCALALAHFAVEYFDSPS